MTAAVYQAALNFITVEQSTRPRIANRTRPMVRDRAAVGLINMSSVVSLVTRLWYSGSGNNRAFRKQRVTWWKLSVAGISTLWCVLGAAQETGWTAGARS